MKLLVYGAGVLGYYLAYELDKAGHEVSILARGSKYESIKSIGLKIKHYIQFKTTITKVNVVKSLEKDDFYDAVFITLQSSQIESIIPILADNKKCNLFVIVGNNFRAKELQEKLLKALQREVTVLFGFEGAGGRFEKERVISVHKKHSGFAIGDISGSDGYKPMISEIFKNTDFVLYHSPDIDSWLKCHLAFILPHVYAIHHVNGNMKKIAFNKILKNDIINSVIEGYEVIEKSGFMIEPKTNGEYFKDKKKAKRYSLLLTIICLMPIGQLVMGNHAMSAIEEMNLLNDQFDEMKKKSGLSTPSRDKLQKYLIKQDDLTACLPCDRQVNEHR